MKKSKQTELNALLGGFCSLVSEWVVAVPAAIFRNFFYPHHRLMCYQIIRIIIIHSFPLQKHHHPPPQYIHNRFRIPHLNAISISFHRVCESLSHSYDYFACDEGVFTLHNWLSCIVCAKSSVPPVAFLPKSYWFVCQFFWNLTRFVFHFNRIFFSDGIPEKGALPWVRKTRWQCDNDDVWCLTIIIWFYRAVDKRKYQLVKLVANVTAKNKNGLGRLCGTFPTYTYLY